MKKQTKQILALLLAITSVFTFMMPTVFANGSAGALLNAEEPVESVVYQFYDSALAGQKLAANTAAIKEAYDAGTKNWRYEAAISGYQFRSVGSNTYQSGMESLQLAGGKNWWYALRLQSPGAGKYDLTLTHGASVKGGRGNSLVYFVKASEVDEILGENAAAYAEAMSTDPYQENGETEIFKAYKAAVEAAFADETAALTPVFKADTATKDLTATGSFTFEADTEYVMVVMLTDKSADDDSSAYAFLESLTATAAEEEETIPPVAAEPVIYQFYDSALAGQKLAANTAAIKEAYDAGTKNWRYEAVMGTYQFRPEGSNTYQPGLESLQFAGGKNQWIAFRIQSPGEGKYDLTLTHGASAKGGRGNSNVFIFKASEVDTILGENAAAYAEAMSADPYQEAGETEIFKTYKAAVEAAFAGETSVLAPVFKADAVTKDLTATGSFTFEADTEYVMVVQLTDKSSDTDGSAYAFLESLTATAAEEEETIPPVAAEPVIYQFYDSALAGQKLAANTAAIKEAYDAGTKNWRYEAAISGYQFRPAGSNTYQPGLESLQFAGGKNQWFAVRIQSPGAGKYDLTLTHGASVKGGRGNSLVYFVKASEIDTALGENAAAYAEAMSADPYQEAGETEIFKAYKAAVEAAFADETAALTPVFNATSTTKNLTATGSFTFEADTEYVMVVMLTDKASETDSSAYAFLNSLAAVPSTAEEEVPVIEPVAYQFYDSAYAGQKLAAHTAEIKEKYDAGNYDWRYEAVVGTYQFRPAGSNTYQPGLESLQFAGGKNQWIAFRIQSPGAGLYNLTLTHGGSVKGAKASEIYFVKASEIDTALGENAAAYAEAMSADPYQEAGETEIFKAYKEAVEAAFADETAAIKPVFYAQESTKNLVSNGRFTFEAGIEYVMVVKLTDKSDDSSAYAFLNSLTAIPSTGEDDWDDEGDEGDGTESTEPTTSEISAYTPGVYQFAMPEIGGTYLQHFRTQEELNNRLITDEITQWYNEDKLNWCMEYSNTYSQVAANGAYVMATITEGSYMVMKIKSPGTGTYELTYKHRTINDAKAATYGYVYVLPVEEGMEYADIKKEIVFKEPVITTGYYSEATETVTVTGSYPAFEEGKEYWLCFGVADEDNTKNAQMRAFPVSISMTRTGEWAPEGPGKTLYTEGVYQFNLPGYAGTYLSHFRTQEELNNSLVTDELAKLYAEGKLNWSMVASNTYSQVSGNGMYVMGTITEGSYMVMKIKSPGTGTYELNYTYLATKDAKAAPYGQVYIVPAEEGKEYDYIKVEAGFRTPIIEAEHYSEETQFITETGTYTAFEEGKEYWLCFGVSDEDYSKNSQLRIFPVSISMTRTGEWAQDAAVGGVTGDIVYQFALEEYVGKTLSNGDTENIYNEVANRYANGSLNWRLESLAGIAYMKNKHVLLNMNKAGNAAIFRIKSPGTGTYRVTLNHLLSSDARAANVGSVYILPYETRDTHTEQLNRLACAPVIETTYSHEKAGTPFTSVSGTYSFEAGKEYMVFIYGQDDMDTNNTTVANAYLYINNLVMTRIGEYVPAEDNITLGGVAIDSLVSVFRTSDNAIITEVNGHDYMAFPTYGGTLMIYDLDEWRMLDEAYIGFNTPRGAAADENGNYWITGDAAFMYCYNPYTMTGFQTPKFLVGGSTHAMTCGDDGYMYFGCYAATGATIFRVDPNNTTADKATYQSWATPTWGKYVGDIAQEGDYIYAAVSGDDRHELMIFNKYTGELVSTHDITEYMGTYRFLQGMDFLEPGVLALSTAAKLCVFNTETREFISPEEFGIDRPIYRGISETFNGKTYMRLWNGGLAEYDTETNKARLMDGELATASGAIRSKGQNFITVDDDRLKDPCLVAYGGMGSDGLNLICYNVVENRIVTLIGLIEPSYGTAQNLSDISNGFPGTGELYIGPAYDAPVGVYNTNTQEFSRTISTNGQSDTFLIYKDIMYIGEYDLCTLTQLKGGEAISLFRLSDEHKIFDQARIHTMTAGDDKIFVGTIPHVYRNGGLIAWYDLETELTYVVTGPNPEDVYYAKASQMMATFTWYSAVTHEEVDFSKEFDQDTNGDGICEYFQGPIPLQSINNLVYRDGLLFGTSTPRGGTGSIDPEGESAQLFIYDVEKMEMVKTYDLRNIFSGLSSTLMYISALEADPDISNKYWGIFSETLFSFTYDKETGKASFKIELSFDRAAAMGGSRILNPRPIIFQGDYMYMCFEKKGGFCKVNRNDPSDYEQILYNFKDIYEIPIDYVLGEDGDLYYLTGDTNLYVFNLNPTEEELASAQAVQDIIALISDTVTLADRETIEAARTAWAALAPANQPYVRNYDILTNAEAALLQCRIDALGDEITLDQEQELIDIGNDYRALTLKQRIAINYLAVSKAQSQMSLLVAGRLVDQIDAIGTVTLDKEEQITAARMAYMGLSRYEQTLITNINVLNRAEAALLMLQLQDEEASAVEKKIDNIGFVFFNFGAIRQAREAYDKLDDETKALVENYGKLIAAEIIVVAECVIAVAAVAGGVLYAIPATRVKIFKKKEKAGSTEE